MRRGAAPLLAGDRRSRRPKSGGDETAGSRRREYTRGPIIFSPSFFWAQIGWMVYRNGIFSKSTRCGMANPTADTMPVVHSLTASAPAMRPLRRRTSGACTSGESSQSPKALPDLPSRRAALLTLILAGSSPARPAAAAFSLGIPGPKELLREQKKKSARFLLAPIAASRDILLKAQGILASANVGAGDAEEVGRLIGAAGRDCVPRQRNSIVAFQSRTGVEVCTFSLILKNAASLLTDKDPLKVEADARLAELIQSLSDLGTVVDNSNFELSADREKMKDGLLSTVSAIDKFEQSVKDCLGI